MPRNMHQCLSECSLLLFARSEGDRFLYADIRSGGERAEVGELSVRGQL